MSAKLFCMVNWMKLSISQQPEGYKDRTDTVCKLNRKDGSKIYWLPYVKILNMIIYTHF